MDLKKLNIFVEGNGKPMLLLHGWGQNYQMMEPIYEAFKKEYRVCNLDLPGFGMSADLEKAYTIYDYVNVIKEVVRFYELDNPIIIAHSFGARIAFYYASMFPVRYLIVSGAAGIKPKRHMDYYIKIYTYKLLKKMHLSFVMGSEDYKRANANMKKTLVHVVNEDASEVIPKIQVPILLVWGEKDEQTPMYMADKILSLNKNATLVVFENEDHFAYYHQMRRFIKVCEVALKGCES